MRDFDAVRGLPRSVDKIVGIQISTRYCLVMGGNFLAMDGVRPRYAGGGGFLDCSGFSLNETDEVHPIYKGDVSAQIFDEPTWEMPWWSAPWLSGVDAQYNASRPGSASWVECFETSAGT